MSVCILDYGSGNVKSVFNLVSAIEADTVVSNDAAQILRATHIILPGVGAFGAAMRRIRERLPLELLERVVRAEKKPFLGICVGMQVLATRGFEFGDFPGLDWIEGTTERLQPGELPLPHIGWNNADATRAAPLLAGMGHSPDFYFVHSFAMRPADPTRVVASTSYGETFCSIVQHDNIFGVQFHPEKSQRAGEKLVRNFLAVA
jgi:imidazole glycerol-phosphate synthase subunit HisH